VTESLTTASADFAPKTVKVEQTSKSDIVGLAVSCRNTRGAVTIIEISVKSRHHVVGLRDVSK